MSDQTPATQANDPRAAFQQLVGKQALALMGELVEPEAAEHAAKRVALAFRLLARENPDVMACDPGSVATAMALCAVTALRPGGVKPEVYLIPRRNKKLGRLELQAQVSVRGLQALAERNGWLITGRVAHVDDVYRVTAGSEATVYHEPSGKYATRWEEIQGVYVTGRHPHWGAVLVDVPLGAIAARRAQAQSDNFWQRWPEEMAIKTAVGYAISRGHFGSLANTADFRAVDRLETANHREQAPARQARRPDVQRITVEVDEDALVESFGGEG